MDKFMILLFVALLARVLVLAATNTEKGASPKELSKVEVVEKEMMEPAETVVFRPLFAYRKQQAQRLREREERRRHHHRRGLKINRHKPNRPSLQ